jgi:hypothetical protein
MIQMTNVFFLDLAAVLDLAASLAVLAAEDASAAAAVDAAEGVAVAAAAADAVAADVNQHVEYSVQKDPCMSQRRGLSLLLGARFPA